MKTQTLRVLETLKVLFYKMKKLILVEDDATNLNLLKMFFELEGFKVADCLNIEQAKAAASEDTAALIIDVHLGRDENGIHLLEDIRKQETDCRKDAVVLILSGDADFEAVAYAAGADAFMLKPFPPHSIIMKLNNLLTEAQHSG